MTSNHTELIEASERGLLVATLVSQRLHILSRDMGFGGRGYDGNYPCSAHHVELDIALDELKHILKGART